MSFQTVSIGQIAQLYDGPHATPAPSEDGPVFLGIKNITDDGHLDFSDIRHVSEQEYPKWTRRILPCKDDIVFTYEATLHRYALIPEGFRGCLGRRVALLRPNLELVDPRYLFYFFRSPIWKSQVTANILTGATVDRVPLTKVPEFTLDLPSLPKQKQIAGMLGTYDDLIANNERRIGLLEEAMHLLYREWFVHLRFPGWEETAVVDGVPEGWQKTNINDAFDILGGGTPSKQKKEFWTDGDINWYTPTDLTKTGLMFKEESILQINGLGLSKSSARIFPPYSVMMTSRATIGAISINTTEACTNQGFITCIPNDQMPLYFLYCWLLTNVPKFISFASGATFKEISKGVFKKLPVIRPDIQLVNTFQETVDPMARQILNLQRQNEKLKEARDALLPRLMSGRIEV